MEPGKTRVLVTGASGTIGRFIATRFLQEGYLVTALGRRDPALPGLEFSPFDLDDDGPHIPAADILIHCALKHVPGKFRGGEGDDPSGFLSANVDGTRRLFERAIDAGCKTIFFLSSRAVYGDHRKGETLQETDPPCPSTLYGEVKQAGEDVLESLCGNGVVGIALRATGVYGRPSGSLEHKWSALFTEAFAGQTVAPRKGTEVHGDDLAGALLCVLRNRESLAANFQSYNVSDLMLDRRELLSELCRVSGASVVLPPPSANTPGEMSTDKLRALGWSPGGKKRLREFLTQVHRALD
ncbi:NAD(P)-dependent oxidoreductase [Rhodobacterales bacterium]|nr:NAD(P)-dependent oxidoreductase [Rhodobacterales bacterium]